MSPQKAPGEPSSMGQRLKHVRTLLKASQKDFSDAIGQTQGIISKLESDKMEIRISHLTDISKKFPFNIQYVISGEGDPLDMNFRPEGRRGIPLLVISGDEQKDPFTDKALSASPVKLALPIFTDCDAVMKVTSDVLSPLLLPEDLAPIKRIVRRTSIKEGRPYLVVTDTFRILRKLYKHPLKEECFVAKTESDESIDVCFDDIKHLFEIRGSVRDFSNTQY